MLKCHSLRNIAALAFALTVGVSAFAAGSGRAPVKPTDKTDGRVKSQAERLEDLVKARQQAVKNKQTTDKTIIYHNTGKSLRDDIKMVQDAIQKSNPGKQAEVLNEQLEILKIYARLLDNPSTPAAEKSEIITVMKERDEALRGLEAQKGTTFTPEQRALAAGDWLVNTRKISEKELREKCRASL